MKQRITVEQLNELTPEQQGRLREWWNPEIHDIVAWTNIVEFTPYGKTQEVRWVSVEEVPVVCVLEESNEVGVIGDGWHDTGYKSKSECLPLLNIGQCIGLLKEMGMNELVHLDHIGAIQDDDFLDALWQAVKEVL